MTVIPLENLAISLAPTLIVLGVFIKWKLAWKDLLIATFRMLIQLMAIGYFLNYIFKQDSPWWTSAMLLFMLSVSSWISLTSVKGDRKKYLKNSLFALFFGALPVLLFLVVIVIPTSPWYSPSFIIPLAGMVFASAMNTIGIGAERYRNKRESNDINTSRRNSLKAALIPQMNSFLAVGLVSLPGMMTGQILSGVDPLIAVRYQIVVMTMFFGAGGIAASIFLSRLK